MPIKGVEATVIGFGLLGAGFGFAIGVAAGAAAVVGLAASLVGSAPIVSIPVESTFFVSLALGGETSAGSLFLPRISLVVAAAISRAEITSPSSGGSGALAGSLGVGFRPFPVLGCGTLRSRTVG